MPVYFHNEGHLDLAFLEVMGLSVKESENSIGRFGTGLKIAIAVLLRTDHKVKLWISDDQYEFTSFEEEARGQRYQRVYMNDKPLPFTTMLGRDWAVWQAYRELRSNAMDEGGEVSTTMPKNDTVIEVRGQKFEQVHADSHTVFLQTQPEHTIDGVEIHEGPGHHLYYHGIRVYDLERPSVKIYNFLGQVDLTEDRTLKYPFLEEARISRIIPKVPDSFLANSTLGRNESFFERKLDLNEINSPCREFLEAAAANSVDMEAHPAARRVTDAVKRSRGFDPATLSKKRQSILDRGRKLAARVFDGEEVCEVRVADDLGPNVFGVYKPGTTHVWISKSCLDMGVDFVAATIVEEWLHRQGHDDYSRRMQDWLLQRLIQEVK